MIHPEWMRLFCNFKLSQHITKVQNILNAHKGEINDFRPQTRRESCEIPDTFNRGPAIPILSRDLLRKEAPFMSLVPGSDAADTSQIICGNDNTTCQKIAHSTPEHNFGRTQPSYQHIDELEAIVDKLIDTESILRKQYGDDLRQSLKAWRSIRNIPESESIPFSFDKLRVEISNTQQIVRDQFKKICTAFTVHDSRFPWLEAANLWPCITPVTLLECLRSTSRHMFGKNMKEAIVAYTISITRLQRVLRMHDAHLKQDVRKLREEQINTGHCNWRPFDYTDWLLLEVDANILIRNEQVEVALATISPASKSNSVLQMNMGQGKNRIYSNHTLSSASINYLSQGDKKLIICQGKRLALCQWSQPCLRTGKT